VELGQFFGDEAGGSEDAAFVLVGVGSGWIGAEGEAAEAIAGCRLGGGLELEAGDAAMLWLVRFDLLAVLDARVVDLLLRVELHGFQLLGQVSGGRLVLLLEVGLGQIHDCCCVRPNLEQDSAGCGSCSTTRDTESVRFGLRLAGQCAVTDG
jgi:hypothetical protein